MATTAKKEEVNPFVLVFLFLAFASAVGGGLGRLGGGKGGGGGATSDDPCEGKPMTHVIESWHTDKGKVELKCGDAREGWEHLRDRDRIKGRVENIVRCIGRTLANGTVTEDRESINMGPQWVYRWQWGARSGERATVRVSQRTGSVLTAFPGSGLTARLWAGCAGR